MNNSLIFGLGNPGKDYEATRHNIGFMAIEALAKKHAIAGKGESKFNAIVGQGRLGSHKILIAQPTTFMNKSGEALQKITAFYKIPQEAILVAYDDVDLPLGKMRFRPEGSAGTHNGMKSVIQCMGTNTIARLRLGVGSPHPEWDLADYVLSQFTPEEGPVLDKVIAAAVEAIEAWVCDGTETAMNRFNGLNLGPV